jgi:hypothetical protein
MSIDFSRAITAEAKAARAAAETTARYTAAIDAHVTAAARDRGYNSAESLASYVASTNQAWAAEAKAFVAWRDAVWAYALEVLADVEAGTKALPDIEALLKDAPKR